MEANSLAGWEVAAVALSTVGTFFNVKRQRSGFLFWILANSIMIAIGLRVGTAIMIWANVLNIIMAAWGWHDWAREEVPRPIEDNCPPSVPQGGRGG